MIQINDDLCIKADNDGNVSYTLMLDKHKEDKFGKPIFTTLGYYTSLESALLGAIKKLCDRAVWLYEGEVREDGKAEDVIKAY